MGAPMQTYAITDLLGKFIDLCRWYLDLTSHNSNQYT